MNMRRQIRNFLRDTRGGATAIVAAAVMLMTVGGAGLVGDHVWVVDQRDTLNTAAAAAVLATNLEIPRLIRANPGISDSQLQAELEEIAQRYVEINLQHLSPDRLALVRESLQVELTYDRETRTVDIVVAGNLGGFLITKQMPMVASAGELEIQQVSGSERIVTPVEVVLAIDTSSSMQGCVGSASNARCQPWENSRISVVKKAAARLVDILNPNPDSLVAVGVVPWHMVVRLDGRTRNEWKGHQARYPKSRHYSATYACEHGSLEDCEAPAEDHSLPSGPPEPWLGCLDEHRMVGREAHATLPSGTDFMQLPDRRQGAFAQAFFPAPYGAGYGCLSDPLPSNYRRSYCYDDGAPDPLPGAGRPASGAAPVRMQCQPADHPAPDLGPRDD